MLEFSGTATAPNSPELKKDGKTHAPALQNIAQAAQIVRALENDNRDRVLKNSRIASKVNAERPYSPQQLRSDGLSWKSNFTTKPLSNLVEKVVPRFTTALKNMRYLTASQLPDRFPDADKKTELFRTEITNTCRAREGWDDLLFEVAQEDVLFGFTALGWLDPYNWFPTMYRQDAFMVPQGTKHAARTAPLVCFRHSYLLHELFDLIRDREAAEANGWNVDNVIKALNEAMPQDHRSQNSNLELVYADLIRENSTLASFTGAKAVEVWHVLVAEVDGNVTHVAFENHSGDELLWRDKFVPRIADMAAFFSFQHGNGKLHSSKGIGRELYAMAGVLDRARNEAVDRLQLSGKLILSCDEKEIKRFRMSVVGNAILIASGYQVQQNKIDGNVESFFTLDRFLSELLDQIAGSASPKVFEGERVTKAAVELHAAREEERRDALIERFLSQFAVAMSTIQRRLCDPDTQDAQAKEMQARLLKFLSEEELAYLADQPAVNTVADFSDRERQQVVLIAQEARGNPLYNQRKLEHRSLTARVSSDFADDVLLPENDPTEQAEQARLQQLELVLLQQGAPVPTSPRDNHVIHLSILRDTTMGVLQHAVDNPEVEDFLNAIGNHATQHIMAAEQQGQKQAVAEFRQWAQALAQTLQKLGEANAQNQAQQPPVAIQAA